MVCRSVGFWRAQGGASFLQVQLNWCRGSQASASSLHRLWYSYSSPSVLVRASQSTPRQQRKLVPMASSTGTREQASEAAVAAAEEPQEAPYGAWESPLTAALVSSGTKRLGGMALAAGDRLLWLEGRPAEGGRSIIMAERLGGRDGAGTASAAEMEGQGEEVTPAGMSVKSKVHEYGGGAFAAHGKMLVFCNQSDQRVYKQVLQEGSTGAPAAHPMTPEYADTPSAVRYADFDFDVARRCVYCVREDGRQRGVEAGTAAAHEPVNDIVAINLSEDGSASQEPRVVESGADFYAFPRLSPDGSKLAWVQWSHPNMPWDRTSLWVAHLLPDGSVSRKICVAGGDAAVVEAPTEPAWSPAGELFFVTDRGSGFWNVHRVKEGKEGEEGAVEQVLGMDAEFSRPFWVFGNASFAFLPGSAHHLVCFFQEKGVSQLGIIDTHKKHLTRLPTDLTDCFALAVGERRVFVAGGAPSKPYGIFEVHLGEAKQSCTLSTVWETFSLPDPTLSAFFSSPRWISFDAPTFPGQLSHAVFYPPHNPRFRAPAEGGKAPLPPLLVRSHGGPTGTTDTMLRLPIQYWTSRGWAVADVNYSGSTGYGREYRERLYGQWGVADVADASACAQFLAERGLVDGTRVATDGSSAGGFTCFASLTFTSAFKAGCSLYGICDLELLAGSDHKFEKYYCDHLVGPLPAAAAVYKERSPIHHIDKLNCPVILFQGLDDKVVPPSQARLMYEAVKAKGLPTALVEYPGEGHGFRQGPNIEQTLEQEYLFFARVLLEIWEVPGISRELVIENLSRPSETS